jgi:metal-responsive CopG/Arc/MetJ family transcriptional regulator
MTKKHEKKVRINISIKPDVLRRVDEAAGPYERSSYISTACVEKLGKDEKK